MCLKAAAVVCVILLLCAPDVLAKSTWGVSYSAKSVCALKGSSVELSCSYTHPSDHKLTEAFWHKRESTENLKMGKEYQGRVEYINATKKHTLRVTNLSMHDEGQYNFRLITNKDGGKYTGTPGVTLSITDLQVKVSPATVREGQSVTLTCSTTCTLTNSPTYIWYKDGIPAQRSSRSSDSRNLYIHPDSSDGSRYSCAVQGQEELRSAAVYPPKNTTVSVHPSGEIEEGSSVTLTCSSDANPSALTYTWYKTDGTRPVSSDQNYTISNITHEHSGLFYCRAMNKIGKSNSTYTHLDVKYRPKNTRASISPSGEIEEGSSVTLTCSSDANPSALTYTWYKTDGTRPVSSDQNYTISNITHEHSGLFYCRAMNEIGKSNSTYTHLDVKYRPKNTRASISPSGETVEGSSVTLTCSSDANPAELTYTWYKRDGTVVPLEVKGEILNFTLTPETTGLYYCEAQNQIGAQNSSVVSVHIKEEARTAQFAAIGATAAAALVGLILGTLWRKKSRSKKITGGSEKKTEQGDPDSVSDNVSAVAMSTKGLDTEDQGDLHYASIQFKLPDTQELPLFSTGQQPQTSKQEDEVQYASLNFPRPRAAIQVYPGRIEVAEDPSGIYSQIKKTKYET